MKIIRATLLDGSRFWIQHERDKNGEAFSYRRSKSNATQFEDKEVGYILGRLQYEYPDLTFETYDAPVPFVLNQGTVRLLGELMDKEAEVSR